MTDASEAPPLLDVAAAANARLPPTVWRATLARALFASLDAEDIHSVGVATIPFDQPGHFSVGLWPEAIARNMLEWAQGTLPRIMQYPWREMRERFGIIYDAEAALPSPAASAMRAALHADGAASCVIALVIARDSRDEEACVGYLIFHARRDATAFIARSQTRIERAAAAASDALAASLAIAREINRTPASSGLEALSKREHEIARLVAEGLSDLSIGARLGISEATVGTHLHRVFRKLGVHTRVELVHALGMTRAR